MKYSLRDFKRAADRHIGDMEPSAQGRAQLTRQVRRPASPLSWLGWAAVVAACLMTVALLNLPAPRSPGGPDELPPPLTGALPTEFEQPQPTPSLAASPAPSAAASPMPSAAASPAPSAAASPAPSVAASPAPSASAVAWPLSTRKLSARDSALLCARDDSCFVGYDYAGRAYILKNTYQTFDARNYAYDADLDANDFYSLAEVLATDEGRAYYGVDDPDAMTQYFVMTLWPRPEAVTWLPDIAPYSWTSYYSELDVGVVYSMAALYNDGMPRYGLASSTGLVTAVEYTDIFGFTSDGVTIASVPALDGYSAQTYRSYGVLNARGEWTQPPVPAEFDMLWADLADNGGSTPVYYALRTYARLELRRSELDQTSYVDYDYGPTLITDLSGNALMRAEQFGYMLVSQLTDAPIPYKDIETGLWGYVDIDLNAVIAPQYLGAQNFGGGLAAVLVEVEPGPETGGYDRLYGFIDETGALVIAPRYSMVISGFTDESGNARVWLPGDGITQHTIDRNGADVSNPLALSWQRLLELRERVPLLARLSTWALLVLLAAVIAWKRLRSYPDGYGAPNRRLVIGFGGYASAALMYAALDLGMQSALPGLMLASSATGFEWTAYALVICTALLGGAIYGWAARARCRTRAGVALSCLAAAALPVAARWLMGMCTRMDVDATLMLALGMAAGALTGADRDDEPVGLRLRLICLALSAALTFGALAFDSQDLTRRQWPAAVAYGEPELTLAPLSDPAKDYLRARAARPELDEDYLEAAYGVDWRTRLDALLAEPAGYALLTLEIPVFNPYLKPQQANAYAYLTPDPAADPERAAEYMDALLAYMYGEAFWLEPLSGQVATARCLVRVGDAAPDVWLDGLMACCRICT